MLRIRLLADCLDETDSRLAELCGSDRRGEVHAPAQYPFAHLLVAMEASSSALAGLSNSHLWPEASCRTSTNEQVMAAQAEPAKNRWATESIVSSVSVTVHPAKLRDEG